MPNVGYFGGSSPALTLDEIKSEICCAYDTHREFTWAEINGVRRVTRIVFSSALINSLLNVNAKVQRDFTYQIVDPFDLVSIFDSLILV